MPGRVPPGDSARAESIVQLVVNLREGKRYLSTGLRGCASVGLLVQNCWVVVKMWSREVRSREVRRFRRLGNMRGTRQQRCSKRQQIELAYSIEISRGNLNHELMINTIACRIGLFSISLLLEPRFRRRTPQSRRSATGATAGIRNATTVNYLLSHHQGN